MCSARSAGSVALAALATPTGPHDPFPPVPAASRYLDDDGGFILDNIRSPEDIEAALGE
jgi:hypothetical protein